MESREAALAQGRAVMALVLGRLTELPDVSGPFDRMAYRNDWLRAFVSASPDTTMVCQCEEVTRADLLGVQPPNYLPRTPAICKRDSHRLRRRSGTGRNVSSRGVILRSF